MSTTITSSTTATISSMGSNKNIDKAHSLSSSMPQQKDHTFYRQWGNIINVGSIMFNLTITTAVMKGFLAQWGWHDELWFQRGFCVQRQEDTHDGSSLATQLLYDTEAWCCFALLVSAVLASVWKFQFQSPETNSNARLLKSKMEGMTLSNYAHGGGHIFLNLIGGEIPMVSFDWSLEGMGYVMALLVFWTGTLRANMTTINTQQAAMLATAVILFQYSLSVPGEQEFSFTQSLIFMFGALDQLLLSPNDKGLTYFLISLSYLPLKVLFVIELTQCQAFFASWGGHVWYDSYLALYPFLLYLAVQTLDHSKSNNGNMTAKSKKLV